MDFSFEFADLSQLDSVLSSVLALEAVFERSSLPTIQVVDMTVAVVASSLSWAKGAPVFVTRVA